MKYETYYLEGYRLWDRFWKVLIHGGLNQEKYLKSCLGLRPISFESTTPEVFKTTFREITDFRPSETSDQTHILETSLLEKVQFLQHKPKNLLNKLWS